MEKLSQIKILSLLLVIPYFNEPSVGKIISYFFLPSQTYFSSPVVNFINILHTLFCLYLIAKKSQRPTVIREKQQNWLSYEKHARKMLMKLTHSVSRSYKTFFSSFSDFRCLVRAFCYIQKKITDIKMTQLSNEKRRYSSLAKKKSFLGSATAFRLKPALATVAVFSKYPSRNKK